MFFQSSIWGAHPRFPEKNDEKYLPNPIGYSFIGVKLYHSTQSRHKKSPLFGTAGIEGQPEMCYGWMIPLRMA